MSRPEVTTEMFVRSNGTVLDVEVNAPRLVPATVSLYATNNAGHVFAFLEPDDAIELARRLVVAAGAAAKARNGPRK